MDCRCNCSYTEWDEVKNKISDYKDLFDIADTHIKEKRQALRNCVNPELGLHILGCAVAYRRDDGNSNK